MALTVLPLGFLFLNVGRVRQHYFEQITCGPRGEYRPSEPQRHQTRQQSGMIDMGVGQQHELDSARVEIQRLAVLAARLFSALEHAAIDEEAMPGRVQQVTGTGDFPRRAEKCEFHGAMFP